MSKYSQYVEILKDELEYLFEVAFLNKNLNDSIVIEEIKADAGMDIGSTLIGMHLKAVAVPIRLSSNTIGSAYVTFARIRPKCIGGIRAVYDDNLM